ncbi:MAG TPA: hypothetical protein VK059_08390 [Nocardioidaceae bacterium]|nr:hypothetical protein [Nocardioidaceae bacterium]
MTSVHGPARARTSPKSPKTPQERRLRVVRSSTRSRPRAPFIVLVVALMALGLIGLLLVNTTMQRGAFELTDLQERADTLQTREQALQLEVASMSSPDRIATKAARFGMVPNASPAFLRLPDGKIIGQPSPALPGTNLPSISREPADRGDGNGNRGGNSDGNGDGDGNRGGDGNGNRNGNGNGNSDGNGNGNGNGNSDGNRNGNSDGNGNGDRNSGSDRPDNSGGDP